MTASVKIVQDKIEKLKALRRSLGWSQEFCAHHLGITYSSLNRWEKGATSPRSKVMLIAIDSFIEKYGEDNGSAKVPPDLEGWHD